MSGGGSIQMRADAFYSGHADAQVRAAYRAGMNAAATMLDLRG